MTTANEFNTAADRFVALYREARERIFASEPADVLAVRDAAIARFAELGVPSHKDEEWKYTSLAPVARTAFTMDDTPRAVDPAAIEPLLLDGAGPRLVFVNGLYTESLSDLAGLPAGVTIELASASDNHIIPPGVLDRCTDLAPLPLARLNIALARDAATIRIARNTQCVEPIHVIHLAAADAGAVVSFPRLSIVAEEGAHATIVENHATVGAAPTLAVALTEIAVGANAHIDHARTTESNANSWHVGAVAITQSRDSRAESAHVAIGGDITRLDFRVSLDGAGADCNLRGLAMLDNSEHVDHHLLVRHNQPNCTSREFFKNVLDGSSRGVFCGRIHVDQDAQKTDGVQTNANLLLSDDAQAETRPQLEIYADDVKCTHGATVGQLDDDAIFYLRARGVPEAEARAILIRGFAGEILDEIRVEALRDRLRQRLFGVVPALNQQPAASV